MGKAFEFIVLLLLVILLLGGFFLYVYVIALGNPFPVPGGKVLGQTDYSYNFSEPMITSKVKDYPVSEQLTKSITESQSSNSQYNLSITDIDLSATISVSNKLQTFEENGWILLPNSYKFQYSYFQRLFDSNKRTKNETIILCHRNFYDPRDNKSCFYMDRLAIEDIIVFDNIQYEIISISIIPAQTSDYLYQPAEDGNYLRIITNSGSQKEPYFNSHLLVITASKA